MKNENPFHKEATTSFSIPLKLLPEQVSRISRSSIATKHFTALLNGRSHHGHDRT